VRRARRHPRPDRERLAAADPTEVHHGGRPHEPDGRRGLPGPKARIDPDRCSRDERGGHRGCSDPRSSAPDDHDRHGCSDPSRSSIRGRHRNHRRHQNGRPLRPSPAMAARIGSCHPGPARTDARWWSHRSSAARRTRSPDHDRSDDPSPNRRRTNRGGPCRRTRRTRSCARARRTRSPDHDRSDDPSPNRRRTNRGGPCRRTRRTRSCARARRCDRQRRKGGPHGGARNRTNRGGPCETTYRQKSMLTDGSSGAKNEEGAPLGAPSY
jgi:hypothetical protein